MEIIVMVALVRSGKTAFHNGLDLEGWGKFYNFAVQFTKSCPKMNETIFDFTLLNPTVRNWGFLENWKSTASVLVP